jgi:hypothetical protein
MLIRCLLLGVLVACGHAVAAEPPVVNVMRLEQGETSPPAKIGDIAWLAAHWRGEGLGGEAEEFIAPAAAGQMMGMFRHLKADGAVNFYEFYVFAEQAGSLTLRLKHFSPLLSGWEEKDEFVEFPLVAIGDQAVYFDGLTYVLEQDGSLTVGVRVAEERNAVFRYRRAR